MVACGVNCVGAGVGVALGASTTIGGTSVAVTITSVGGAVGVTGGCVAVMTMGVLVSPPKATDCPSSETTPAANAPRTRVAEQAKPKIMPMTTHCHAALPE